MDLDFMAQSSSRSCWACFMSHPSALVGPLLYRLDLSFRRFLQVEIDQRHHSIPILSPASPYLIMLHAHPVAALDLSPCISRFNPRKQHQRIACPDT